MGEGEGGRKVRNLYFQRFTVGSNVQPELQNQGRCSHILIPVLSDHVSCTRGLPFGCFIMEKRTAGGHLVEDSQDVGCTQHSVRPGGGNHGSEDSGGQEVYLQMHEFSWVPKVRILGDLGDCLSSGFS